jgi:hypothetical protein
MRHARFPGFGDAIDWHQWWAAPTEVYVWRAYLQNAVVEEPADAQLLLRAVARAAADLSMDVRGIVINDKGGADVVMTSDTHIPYILPPTATDVKIGALADSQLRARYPQVDLVGERFLQLTGPPASVDFWRAHATVWDDKVGPLDAFAKLEGIYRGHVADEGPALQAWTVSSPPLEPPPPHPSTAGISPAVLFAGAVVLAGAAWALLSKERAR